MWYPVDGGFVPVDAVSSVASQDGEFQLFQDAAPDVAAEDSVEPVAQAGSIRPRASGSSRQRRLKIGSSRFRRSSRLPKVGSIPPPGNGSSRLQRRRSGSIPTLMQSATLYQEADPNALATESVDPAAAPVAEAPASEGWVDPATGQWVEPAPVSEGWVDPATGQWVEPAPDLIKRAGWIPALGNGLSCQHAADERLGRSRYRSMGRGCSPPKSWRTGPLRLRSWWLSPRQRTSRPSLHRLPPAAPSPGASRSARPTSRAVAATARSVALAPTRGTDGSRSWVKARPSKSAAKRSANGSRSNCAGIGGYVNTSLIAWEPSAASADSRRARAEGRGNRDNN